MHVDGRLQSACLGCVSKVPSFHEFKAQAPNFLDSTAIIIFHCQLSPIAPLASRVLAPPAGTTGRRVVPCTARRTRTDQAPSPRTDLSPLQIRSGPWVYMKIHSTMYECYMSVCIYLLRFFANILGLTIYIHVHVAEVPFDPSVVHVYIKIIISCSHR